MSEEKSVRLSAVLRQINTSREDVVNFLSKQGFTVDNNPNAKISADAEALVVREFASSAKEKAEAQSLSIGKVGSTSIAINNDNNRGTQNRDDDFIPAKPVELTKGVKLGGTSPAQTAAGTPAEPAKAPAPTPSEEPAMGLKVLGKIDLSGGPKIMAGPKAEAPSTSEAAPEPASKPAPAADLPKVETEKPKAEPAPVVEAAKVEPVKVVTPEPVAEAKAPVAEAPKAPEVTVAKAETAPAVSAPVAETPAPVANSTTTVETKADLGTPAPTSAPVAEAPAVPAAPRKIDLSNQPPSRREKERDREQNKGQSGGANAPKKDGGNPQNKGAQGGNNQGGNKPNQGKGGPGGNNQGNNQPRREQGPKVPPPINPALTSISNPVDPNAAAKEPEVELIEAKADTLKGLTVLGKIDVSSFSRGGKPGQKPGPGQGGAAGEKRKRERKRVKTNAVPVQGNPVAQDPNARPPRNPNAPGGGAGGNNQNRGPRPGGGYQGNNPRPGGGYQGNRPNNAAPATPTAELTDKQIQEQIKQTLARLSGNNNRGGGIQAGRKHRKDKRYAAANEREEQNLRDKAESKILKVAEFISANDLASLMDVSVNEVISTCMSLGMFVSINQRLDAEAITVIADEFGFDVQFINAVEEEDIVQEAPDSPEDLVTRAPIVTIMGHVDHGKTSLLDYIRKTKVVASEAGGITQHIGAYDVMTDSGKRITFLDTPGHEAFTAMRARGAKVTDIVIIVIAADDSVMPQTKEAINHALVAGVPIVIAINKIDRPAANPEKIKEELAQLNILVEDWGGKYQVQEISAKSGQGVSDLLEKVLLEAEILELTANPNKRGSGTVIESMLDKGRGYVTTFLVQTGNINIGDVVLVGANYGKVKAMFNHLGKRIKTAGPSTPVQMLGLSGAPQSGERFNVLENEREARELATKREQILREQSIRTRKHLTLDDIGRRLAIGNFKELNIILKGDVDGSVEALSDSFQKLSTPEIQINILHKAVGQISESDVLLASASDAIIIGFQVRPSPNARRIAEQEEIEIRSYSIIYDAINDIKSAMEGMLAPTFEEVVVGTMEIRQVFKISKSGNVAGCMVQEGYIKRNNPIRLIRNGIVMYTGTISALKRFKDDVSEVKFGYECGLSLDKFNDLVEGDTLESFEKREVKRKL
ncbi:MAG: translation initiation factor IF-2 [Flexibacteraceae bacterium]